MPRAPRSSLETPGDMGPSGGLGPHGRPDYYEQTRPSWQQAPQQPGQQHGPPGSYSPGSRMMGPGMYQQEAQPAAQEHHYGYQSQEAQAASAMSHQQDHRGVAQLQGAASAASGMGRPGMMHVSGAQNASLTQPMNSLAGVGGMLQGGQADLNKRGPVEFNHAISYVNKIKVSFVILLLLKRLLTSPRIGFQVRQRSTSSFWRFCRHINASRSRSRTSTPRSHNCLIQHLTFWKISNNSCQSPLLTHGHRSVSVWPLKKLLLPVACAVSRWAFHHKLPTVTLRCRHWASST